MAKVKKIYYCQHCGARYSQWMGQCPSCKKWNTIVEEVVSKRDLKQDVPLHSISPAQAFSLGEINTTQTRRISTGNKELDLVLGGGLVPGSVILLGGEPGIGKSTLMLQTALQIPHKVLYISGEESPEQIAMRASRLGFDNPKLKILPQTHLQKIFPVIEAEKPEILVIDSIQTLYTDHVESAPGSVSQIRETAAELIKLAKQSGIPVFIIGHITKEGYIAGPKVLEHMVDTVLQFEGDRHHQYRILRSLKNRFGSTHEIGIFEMTSKGLETVENPSGVLFREQYDQYSGTAAGVIVEGMRTLIVETQALVSPAVYGTPQRSVTGYDPKRLNMILAVLEKKAGYRLSAQDVFVNIAGGFRITDPGLDLAVAAAILSSVENKVIPPQSAWTGEIGLTGEIRPVSHVEKRIAEAGKNGFEVIYLSAHHKLENQVNDLKIRSLSNISELASLLKR